jgi:hypothetical protein
MDASTVSKSLVRVGDGRGFVVEEKVAARRRLVITAAHCLPAIPELGGERSDWAETFPDLIGLLAARPSVSAECLFVDPIADIAVLGAPDSQELCEHADAYETFLASRKPLKVGGAMDWDMPAPASLIALDGHLIVCAARCFGGPLLIEDLAEPSVGGMSGSPVLDQAGVAVGIVSESSEKNGIVREGSAPRLVVSLPGQFLISLGATSILNTENRLTRNRFKIHAQPVR